MRKSRVAFMEGNWDTQSTLRTACEELFAGSRQGAKLRDEALPPQEARAGHALTPPSPGNTGYTRMMAKVMVSLPDDLLERIDMRARARHATRSGFLRELAERELAAEARQSRTEIEGLLGEPVRLGGDATRLIRQDRLSH